MLLLGSRGSLYRCFYRITVVLGAAGSFVLWPVRTYRRFQASQRRPPDLC